MNNHEKMKNFDTYFEAAIVGIGMIIFFGGSIILSVIKLVELIIK
jgi:hypothetical protein